MTTGASFATLPLKSLLGFGDLNTRFLQYLKQTCIDATKARWDIDGVFASKLSLASAGASKFTISGTSRSTDGQGHLLDVTQIGLGNSLYASTLFENTNAVTYYVGLKYCEVPSGVRTNPRNGMPEYISFREEIGVSGVPNAVALVSGQLIFTVDSVTEAAVSNAGRYVMVYKNVPGDLAVSDALALPAPIAVTWTGSNNKISAPTLGQSTPSLVAADYTVALIGPAVKRNTNLTTAPGYVFLSTVIGAGVSNPPGAFDNSAQQLLVTFEDADVVRAELEAFEAALLSNAGPGASLVGVAPSAFQARKPIVVVSTQLPAATVGIGNQADGSLPANARLTDLMVAVDKQISRTRGWSGTAGTTDGSAEISDGGLGDASRSGGAYFLKRGTVGLVDGAFQTAAAPMFLGETSAADPESANARKRSTLNFNRGSSRNSIQPGHYERLFLQSTHASNYLSVNGVGVTPGGKIIDCVIAGGQLDIDGAAVASAGYEAFRIQDSVVDCSITALPTLLSSALTFGVGGSNSPAHGVIQNTVFIGPQSSQTSPAVVAVVHVASGLGAAAGMTATLDNNPLASGTQDRPLVFQNCTFFVQRIDTPAVRVSTKQKVVFENCHFYGIGGQTAPLFQADANSHIIMKNCMMFAPEGQFFNGIGVYGSIENLTMISGDGTAVAHPQAFVACGAVAQCLQIRNASLQIGASNVRAPGSQKPIVQLGRNSATYGQMDVDGFRILYGSAALGIHGAETLAIWGTDAKSSYNNVSVDFNGNRPTAVGDNNTGSAWTGITSAFITLMGQAVTASALSRPLVTNLSVRRSKNPASTNLAMAIVAMYGAEVRNFSIQRTYVAGDAQLDCHVHVRSRCIVEGYTDDADNINPITALFSVAGDRNQILKTKIGNDNVTLGGSTPPTIGILSVNGDDNLVDGLLMTTAGTSWLNQIGIFGRNTTCTRFNCAFSNPTPGFVPVQMGLNGGADEFQAILDSYFAWDANPTVCIVMQNANSMVIGNRFRKLSGGAHVALSEVAATGQVTSPNLTA